MAIVLVLLFALGVAVVGYLAVRIRALERRLEAKRLEASRLEIDLAKADAERAGAVRELERYREDEAQRAVRVRAEIENLSNRIFEEKTGKFKEIGTSAIAQLVAPVRENLDKLQKALAESETKDAVREQSLREALERVGRINARLGDQADGLAKALKGDNKAVGDFGEEILERLLEYSGLKRGANFVVQGEGLDLRSEAGRRLMPDVVIFLPENRCLVVDSKMSLKSWADAQTVDEAARAAALDDFRRSTRAHVDDLSGKPYTEAIQAQGKVSVDFKFLFFPVESAFHTALQLDRGLYQYAFDRKIILVSPTTLLAVLATVSHTWEQFEIGRNALEIRDRANLLLDKLLDFLGSMEKVGDQLDKARGAFDEARNRLSEGRGNLVGQAKKLQALGVRSDKTVPRTLEADTKEED